MAGRDVTDGVTSLTGRLTSLQTRNVVEPRKRRKILHLFFLPVGLECGVILSSSTTEAKRNLRNFLKQSRLQPQHDFPKTHIETLLPKSPSRPRHYSILANGTGDGKEKSVNTQSKTDRLFFLFCASPGPVPRTRVASRIYFRVHIPSSRRPDPWTNRHRFHDT